MEHLVAVMRLLLILHDRIVREAANHFVSSRLAEIWRAATGDTPVVADTCCLTED